MKKELVLISVYLFLTQSFSYPEIIELEPIIVEPHAGGKEEISPFYSKRLGNESFYSSAEDALSYFPSLDLRKRGSFGIQQDLSVRGSNFEDNRILVNGIEVNDAQTGHFSLETPFLSEDLESVSLSANSQRVDFRLKKPESSGGVLKTSWGEYGFKKEALSVNFPLKRVKNRLSFGHRQAKASIEDTDFETYNFTLDSIIEKENSEFELVYGFLKKDFGAGGFYAAPVYMQEEEHTSQHFFSLRSLFKEDGFNFQVTPFFRRHSDKFILDRHNPSFYTNSHKTYSYGIDNNLRMDDKGILLNWGFKGDKITSTNLGNHGRGKSYLAINLEGGDKNFLFLKTDLNWIYYSGQGIKGFSDFEARHYFSDFLSLSFLYSRVLREPSFTELYYSSPSNMGNPGLKLQKMDNFEVKLLYSGSSAKAGVSLFFRNQHNTIDWVRNSKSDPWQAENAGRIKARGADFNFDLDPRIKFLKKIGFKYSFLDLQGGNNYNYSKYLFNYIKNRFLIQPELSFKERLKIKPVLIIEKPRSSRSRLIADLSIIYGFSGNLSLSLSGKNIFNEEYEELESVKASPRWWRISLDLTF